MDAYLFNVLKYIGRSGKKDDNPPIQDLKKAFVVLRKKKKQLKMETNTIYTSDTIRKWGRWRKGRLTL